jgi:glycosyltransferase involved in cell wall biosynthesis
MTQPFVTITVPVYNTEKDIRRCIESLINQTLHNIEIILVDDGSPDRCGSICDEYAAKDSRIKVIHKENGGSSSARNVGLKSATGIYYTVCDSDDWVELTMYEELYKCAVAENADIVTCDYYNEYSDGKQVRSSSYTYTTQEQYIEDLMLRKASVSTWSKLFRLEMIRNLGVDYTEGVNLGEDALFLLKILLSPQKITTLHRALYHYQRDINSLSYTNNITLKGVDNAAYLHQWRVKNYNKKIYQRALQYSLINYLFLFLRCKDTSPKQYRVAARDVSLVKLIRHRALTTKAMLVVSTKYLGLNFGKLCLRKLYKQVYK